VFASAALATPPAFADVTITIADISRGRGGPGPGDTRTLVKGARERLDQGPVSTIIDLDAGRMVVLDHPARTATVYALDSLRPKQQDYAQVVVDVELTKKTKRVGDLECREAKISQSSVNPNRTLSPSGGGYAANRDITTGSVWIAIDAPGADEFRAFNRRLDEFGAIVTDFAMARRRPVEAVAQAKFATALAMKGIPCSARLSSRNTIGPGPWTVGGTFISPMHSDDWEVRTVSIEPIPDAAFEVPTGYAVEDLSKQ
jgi:hypothetical protein